MPKEPVRRFRRPRQIPDRLWRSWNQKEMWKKAVVAFLAEHMGEEFTVLGIKKGTGLSRLLSDRMFSLAQRLDKTGAGVKVKLRVEESPYRVWWRMEEKGS